MKANFPSLLQEFSGKIKSFEVMSDIAGLIDGTFSRHPDFNDGCSYISDINFTQHFIVRFSAYFLDTSCPLPADSLSSCFIGYLDYQPKTQDQKIFHSYGIMLLQQCVDNYGKESPEYRPHAYDYSHDPNTIAI
jgi:hypothetical protein